MFFFEEKTIEGERERERENEVNILFFHLMINSIID